MNRYYTPYKLKKVETPKITDFQDVKEFEIFLKSKIATYPNFPDPNVNFKDIQSILYDPELSSETLHFLTELLPKDLAGDYAFNKIICFDARGFLFGFSLASVAFVPMVMARKPGKLPGEKVSQTFKKEYKADNGKEFETIQIQKGLINPGDRVLIHDDLLATGGTASAAAEIVKKCGAEIIGFHFVMDLTFLPGRSVLQKYVSDDRIISLVKY